MLHQILGVLVAAITFTAAVNAQSNSLPDSGNVGLGTTSADAQLEVFGSAFVSRTPFSNPNAYTAGDLVLGSNTDARQGYGSTTGSHLILRSSGKSTITALDEMNNLGQISYQDLRWTFGEDIGWGAQTVFLPGRLGVGIGMPGGQAEIYSADPSALANLVLSSGQSRNPRIRFNGPWSVTNPSESYAQIVAINDNGGPGDSASSLHFFTASGDPAALTDKMTITGRGNVGIGTTTPAARMEVASTQPSTLYLSGSAPSLFFGGSSGVDPNSNANTAAAFVGYSTYTGSYAQGVGDLNIATQSRGAGNSSAINFLVPSDNAGNYQLAAKITREGNVGIGTAVPGAHKLAVNGSVKAKEVVVETAGWSDYVFAPGYELMPLSKVEEHIQRHRHLPGIPSGSRVVDEGVSLGQMQAMLLAKIEELTLHVIAQQKEIERLKQVTASPAEATQ